MNLKDIQPQNAPAEVGDYIGNVFTILLSLAVIIILIIVLIRFLGRKNRLWQGNRGIRTIGGTVIGQNKSLQIVEVGDVVYVLGIGEDVTLIDKISDPEQVANLTATLQQDDQQAVLPIPATMKTWMKTITVRNKKQEEITHSEEQSSEMAPANFHEMLHAKLERQSDRAARMEQLLNNDTKEER